MNSETVLTLVVVLVLGAALLFGLDWRRRCRPRWTPSGAIHAALGASWRSPQRAASSRGNPAEMKDQKAMQELAEGADLWRSGL